MKLSTAAGKIKAQHLGADAEFGRVSTDTRTLVAGDLFVALIGEHFDGHEYVMQAFEKGAIAAMVSRAVPTDQPLMLVEDTLQGLGQLAVAWAAQFSPRKVAITGSCGKTTLKEMLAAILSSVAPTLATRGNLNNEIGVPLTLCQLQAEHQFAVVECGANHIGEIAYTAGLVQPDVAVVNIVAPAHLEGFGSIGNVAKAKGEIYGALKADGIAVINLDDSYATQYLEQTSDRRQITFSLSNSQATIFGESVQCDASGRYRISIHTGQESIDVVLPLLGKHNVRNALAATALALALDIGPAAIKHGLESVKPAKGRLYAVTDIVGYHLIDDSYNANPASIKAAIDVLAESSNATCLVLGGMGELGPSSDALHAEVGAYAAVKGVTKVYSLGSNAVHYQSGFEAAGKGGEFIIATDHAEIARALMEKEKNKLILVKGSRSTTMEKVIEMLREQIRMQEETR